MKYDKVIIIFNKNNKGILKRQVLLFLNTFK